MYWLVTHRTASHSSFDRYVRSESEVYFSPTLSPASHCFLSFVAGLTPVSTWLVWSAMRDPDQGEGAVDVHEDHC